MNDTPDQRPASPEVVPDESMTMEPPETERFAKLTGENAKLRAEVRQALARSQRAEAEVTRVRSSTKFLVGDLLVKSAKNPRRAALLPRDLYRLYRLRRHRRTQVTQEPEALPGRMRRSDYTDEIAARLLLPRVGGRPDRPLSIAGALDPARVEAWASIAAVTPVLPHDAGTLTQDVDPDVVVIDALTTLPTQAWSHLGNPAATDRAYAAAAMIDAAKEHGRPVALIRCDPHDAGLDAIAARCDVTLSGPGAPRGTPWQPGVDLALASAILRASGSALGSTEDPAEDSAPSGLRTLIEPYHRAGGAASIVQAPIVQTPIVQKWSAAVDHRGGQVMNADPRRPGRASMIDALRRCDVVALHGHHDDSIVGAPELAIAALVSRRLLVSPLDTDLAGILDINPESAPQIGWFPYPSGDQDAADDALAAALDVAAAPRSTINAYRDTASWQIWRAIFDRATPAVAWSAVLDLLGLAARPLAMRDAALIVRGQLANEISTDPPAFIASLLQQTLPPREILVTNSIAGPLRCAVSEVAGDQMRVVPVSDEAASDPVAWAQAASAPVLLETSHTDVTAMSPLAISDSILAYELSGSPSAVRLTTGQITVTATSRLDVLHAGVAATRIIEVEHPGWPS